MEPQATAIIGPVISETMALWGIPGLLAAAAIAAAVWLTKGASGIRGEMADTITRLDNRVKFLAEERDNAIAEAREAREEAFKWRESYLAKAYPGSGHEDIAARTGMEEEQA